MSKRSANFSNYSLVPLVVMFLPMAFRITGLVGGIMSMTSCAAFWYFNGRRAEALKNEKDLDATKAKTKG